MTALLPALILLTTGLPQDPRIEQCRKNLAELGKLVPGGVELRKDPSELDLQIADLSKQQAVPNPLFDAWKSFKAGSWVKLKVETIEDGEKTVSEETETLFSRTAEKIVLQRKTLSTLGGQPFTSTDQEDIPAATASILKIEKGKDEEIEVAGKKVACRILLVTKAAKESIGEIRHKLWMNDDVPGGVVRSESVAVRQNRVVATAVALGGEKK